MTSRIGLLGAGSQAREILSYLPRGTDVFWAVTEDYLDPSVQGHIDIAHPSSADRETAVIGAVGGPGLRRALVSAWPGEHFATVISTAAYVDPSCEIRPGTAVGPGAILTVDVVVGRHCQINVGATLSHDVRLGDFVTVGPGVHVAGHITVGDGAFLGIGATLADGVTLAPGVVVGAGATVLDDVATANTVVVGTPARPLRVDEDWLYAL